MNPYQQQPQIPISKPRTNNLDGWFTCYKIALVLDILFRTYMIMDACHMLCIRCNRPLTSDEYKIIGASLFPLAFDLIQFIVMTTKNSKTAKIALGGHLCFFLFMVYYTVISSFSHGEFLQVSFLISLSATVLYVVMVIFGSFKVQQSLSARQIQSDNYQGYFNA